MMLKRKTTFVVGAGASAEFGLPIGSELSRKIRSQLSFAFEVGQLTRGDEAIFSAIKREAPENLEAYVVASRRIAEGLALHNSIDNFIDNHQHDERVAICGKLAIARSIIEAEQKSPLKKLVSQSAPNLSFDPFVGTWMFQLFKILQEGVRRHDLASFFSGMSFVVFNYDRCIEVFFRCALMGAYGINEEEAANLVDAADIVHVFGQLGTLPLSSAKSGVVAFGDVHAQLNEVALGLRTYTEQMDDGAVKAVKMRLQDAECIVLLGFGYHPTNLEILSPRTKHCVARTVIGTGTGLSNYDARRIEQELQKWTFYPAPQIIVDPGAECIDLISQYSRAFR